MVNQSCEVVNGFEVRYTGNFDGLVFVEVCKNGEVLAQFDSVESDVDLDVSYTIGELSELN